MLTLALPKGRLLDPALTLLAGKGLLDADSTTVPVSYTVTSEGLRVLAEDGGLT